MLTRRQREVLHEVIRATLAERWHRASGDRKVHTAECGTLARLYREGLLIRKRWRKEYGSAACYEYQAPRRVLEDWRPE